MARPFTKGKRDKPSGGNSNSNGNKNGSNKNGKPKASPKSAAKKPKQRSGLASKNNRPQSAKRSTQPPRYKFRAENTYNKKGDQSAIGPIRFPPAAAAEHAHTQTHTQSTYNLRPPEQRPPTIRYKPPEQTQTRKQTYKPKGERRGPLAGPPQSRPQPAFNRGPPQWRPPQQQNQQRPPMTGKRKRDKFQLRLPSVKGPNGQPTSPQYKDVAWFEHFDQYSPTQTDETTATTTVRSPSNTTLCTDFFPTESLNQLSQELQAFAGYVRLQPTEHDARQFMIQFITNLAGSTFSGTDVHLQVFGSYATPAVCTYCSDVDMALWGVVEAPQQSQPQQQGVLTKFNNDDHHDDDKPPPRDEELDRKELKVQKWRDLLLEFENQEEEEEEKKEDEKPISAELFVIDRTGENDDDVIDLTGKDQEVTATPQELDDDDEKSDSDDDSADKLENLKNKRSNGATTTLVTEYVVDDDDDSEESVQEPPRKRRRPTDDLSSSDSDDEDRVMTSSDGLEVSYHASRKPKPAAPMVIGPTGKTRTLVVNALRSLGNGLRKNRMFCNIEVRRFARVPIVTMETRLGFEGDVAIGGHNGTDTSQFAATLVKKYASFAPVVLFLKILLNQQDLDKPFTGGLGSYKLYVLVCHHLEIHLSLGGKDEPGEVLASFFYRFGGDHSSMRSERVSRDCQTILGKGSAVECHDGNSADLGPCHHLEHCIELFTICWKRLSKRLASKEKSCSYLVDLVRQQSLQVQRQDTVQRASNLRKYTGETGHSSGPSNRSGHTTFAGPKISQFLGKRGLERKPAPKPAPVVEKPIIAPPKEDAEEQELLRGYGVRRDLNGTLIPRTRPDVDKKPGSLADQVLGKVSKNRKSKKKQDRDKGLQAIAQDLSR